MTAKRVRPHDTSLHFGRPHQQCLPTRAVHLLILDPAETSRTEAGSIDHQVHRADLGQTVRLVQPGDSMPDERDTSRFGKIREVLDVQRSIDGKGRESVRVRRSGW